MVAARRMVARGEIAGPLGCSCLYFAAVLCAGTALLAFEPRLAQASCGDYVMVHGAHGMAHPSAAGTTHLGSRRDQAPGGPTCHGPSCRRQVPPPFAPQRHARSAASSHWACCLNSPELSSLDYGVHYGAAAGFIFEEHPFFLLRPPRRHVEST